MILNRGTQIVYVPDHIEGGFDGSFEYPNGSQPGFVLAGPMTDEFGNQSYFCRYWILHRFRPVHELRTKANSELTPIRLCLIKNTVPQEWVDNWIAAYLSKQEAPMP